MLISEETSKALDLLYNQFFNLNSVYDNAVSYMLNEWCMPHASEVIHKNLAHAFPVMADMISEIKDNYDEKSVRTTVPTHDETYDSLYDMMNNLYSYCANTYEMMKITSKIAMDNGDLNVLADLVEFTSTFNKIMGQVITLKGKSEQINDYDKFDRHIDTWGIIGLGG